jgi:hypothetical protein
MFPTLVDISLFLCVFELDLQVYLNVYITALWARAFNIVRIF